MVFSSTIAPTRLWSFQLPKDGQRDAGDILAFPSTGSKDYFPSLSATGKMAYFSQKSEKWDLWVRDLHTGRETWLASLKGTDPYDLSTVIKPDGSRVIYSHCPGVLQCVSFTVAATGGPPEKLCDDCGQIRAWSFDGTALASQEWLPAEKRVGSRIDRVDPVTGKKAILVATPGEYLTAPDLSPDGRWVAFQARDIDSRYVQQLFVAPLDGPIPIEPARWVTITGRDHFDAQAKWSPDGKALYFTSTRDGSNCLWAVRLDDTTKKPIGEPYAVRHFHASPRQFSWAVWPIFSLGPDRIAINLEQVQSDLWMMHLPDEQ